MYDSVFWYLDPSKLLIKCVKSTVIMSLNLSLDNLS